MLRNLWCWLAEFYCAWNGHIPVPHLTVFSPAYFNSGVPHLVRFSPAYFGGQPIGWYHNETCARCEQRYLGEITFGGPFPIAVWLV